VVPVIILLVLPGSTSTSTVLSSGHVTGSTCSSTSTSTVTDSQQSQVSLSSLSRSLSQPRRFVTSVIDSTTGTTIGSTSAVVVLVVLVLVPLVLVLVHGHYR
jgi:hypothetical protein